MAGVRVVVGLTVEARYYPGARHEIFNETNRDDVVTDLLDWLDLVKKAQKSEAAR